MVTPRMLLALFLEFKRRRGEILKLIAKKKEKDEPLRVPSAGRRNSTRVDEGRKG